MLTVKLRTIELSKIIELWEEDKSSLIDELLLDYEDLKNAYRQYYREFNQNSRESSRIFLKHISFDRVNYKRELGLDKLLVGKVRLATSIEENIEITNSLIDYNSYNLATQEAYIMKEIVRLKAREIEKLLAKLKVKVNYVKDFEKDVDKWLEED